MPRHIGIVACSAEGSALWYLTICVEGVQLLGAHGHPEISMHTHPLGEYMRCIYRDDWQGVGEVMLSSAHKLAKIGADFLICPDNTMHKALACIEARSPLPWLNMAEVGAAHAVARGFRRLGLTGTGWLVESEIYPEKLTTRGVEYVRPNPAEREEINRIIMDELVYGVFKPEAVAYFQQVIGRMKTGQMQDRQIKDGQKKNEGFDPVFVGFTQIPFI